MALGAPLTERWRRWIVVAVALVIIDAATTFENVWPTPGIRWRGAISIELAACLFALTVLRRSSTPLSTRALGWLAAVWTLLLVGRYADVTAPALYGRDINLYWDIRYMPDVAAMIVRVTPIWMIAAVLAVATLFVWIVFRVLRWAWTIVGNAMATTNERRALTALSIAALAVFAIDRVRESRTSWVYHVDEYHDDARAYLPTPVAATYARQVWLLLRAVTTTAPLPATPPLNSDLARVRDADVFVVFMESYGATAFDRPEIAGPLAATLAQLDSAIRETNRSAVSAFVESPTYGGSSWLAHVSLLSGIEVREAGTNARLMTQHRDTVVRAFGRQGFRTVALMPGMRGPWPEGAFYGFDEIYGADRLAYHGPEFGWFAVPDQFSLFRLDALEVDRPARPPLFVFFPTISPHFPFSPTPPYQPDWQRLSTSRPFDGADIARAYEREPDWVHFAPGYVESMAYDLASIAGYLRRHRGRDLVLVLLGDHQPPALVSGEGAPWDVPVHVITDRADVAARLVDAGFRRGLAPARPAIGHMHALGPLMLDVFGSGRGQAKRDNVRSNSLP